MPFWEREPFPGFINEEHFAFSDHGPLQSPIKSFKLRRNEKLQLRLETLGGKEAIQQRVLRMGETAYIEEDQNAEIKSIGGLTVKLSGVIPEFIQTTESYRNDTSELRETADVFGIEAEIQKDGAAYTIDWLENLGHYYHWPQIVVNGPDTVYKRTYGRAQDSLLLNDSGGAHSSGSAALRLNIGGIELYLTDNSPKDGAEQIEPGYILYLGTPNDETRRKIRTVLSFALGMYLVDLGHSTYTTDWHLTSFRAIGGYSMDMRAFDLHTTPPAWLGTNSHNVLDTTKVARLVSGLYAHYDQLDFGNLSWGYWHAMCAPLHIKAVHFGAIIEALQRNYLAAHASEFSEKVVADSAKWDTLVKTVGAAIDGMDFTDEQKDSLRVNIGRLNQMPRATVTDHVLQHLGLVLGEPEKQAWKRRHDAAHGNPMTPGKEREVIRDTHLLRVIFNRIVLRIVNRNDHYYDYAARPTNGFPFRNLSDPVPQAGKEA